MSYKEFHPFDLESIQVKFKCDNCGKEILSDFISVPPPDHEAESNSESYNSNDELITCEYCDKDFFISVYVSFADGYVDISDISDDDIIEVIEYPEELDEYQKEQIETILFNADAYRIFNREKENLRMLNEIELVDIQTQTTLKRLIFSGAITCLEDFLSTILINSILRVDKNFKRFVRTFNGIRIRNFKLGEIYDKLEQINDIVKKELMGISYHDLSKVKDIFEDTFEIEFPVVDELMAIIKKRHDMVHRNGKNKDGVELQIDKDEVNNVINKVDGFVNQIARIMIENNVI